MALIKLRIKKPLRLRVLRDVRGQRLLLSFENWGR